MWGTFLLKRKDMKTSKNSLIFLRFNWFAAGFGVATLLFVLFCISFNLQPFQKKQSGQMTTTNTKSNNFPEEDAYQIALNRAGIYSVWQTYIDDTLGFSFEHPEGLEVNKMKDTGKLVLALPDNIELPGGEFSSLSYTVFVSADSLSSLTKVYEDDPSMYTNLSTHKEKFGKNTFTISKGEYADGPCSGSLFYRAILPMGTKNIVVDNEGCYTINGTDRRVFETMLSSFKLK